MASVRAMTREGVAGTRKSEAGSGCLRSRRAVMAGSIAMAALLTGCASGGGMPPVQTGGMASVDRQIAEAVDRSSRANRAIAEVEAAASAPTAPAPAQTVPEGVTLPQELNQLYSVEWRGPLEPLLESIADDIGYRFIRTGTPPGSPVTVSVYRTDEPVWRIVRDAGTLVTSQAAVVLNPRDRSIEVRYAQRRR